MKIGGQKKEDKMEMIINDIEYMRADPVEMKPGYSLWVECIDNPGCNNGNYLTYTVTNQRGQVVASGITCRCGRGCSGTDCIRDDWGYRDTAIERYRA
jgi:hypothetical protein